MAGSIVRAAREVIDSAFNGKISSELNNGADMVSGKAARDAAEAEANAAKKAQEEKDAAQMLYDQQSEENKKQAAARARQKSISGGTGRSGTILTSPLGSMNNQTASDDAAKTLLGL